MQKSRKAAEKNGGTSKFEFLVSIDSSQVWKYKLTVSVCTRLQQILQLSMEIGIQHNELRIFGKKRKRFIGLNNCKKIMMAVKRKNPGGIYYDLMIIETLSSFESCL